jgi:hypothetical protein
MAGRAIILVSARMTKKEKGENEMAKKRKRRGPYDPYPGWAPQLDEAEFYRQIGSGPVSFTRPGSPPPTAPAAEPAEQLNQRSKRHRRQGRAPLQSVEQAGKAAL